MPENEKSKKSSWKDMLDEVSSFWPGIPFLAYGLWLAWNCITFTGTAWLSDVEVDLSASTRLFVVSNLTYGIICLVSTVLPHRLKIAIDSNIVTITAGVLSSLGSFVIIASGPYYLMHVLGDVQIQFIFYPGVVMTGIGSAIMVLRLGVFYGSLPPRRGLLYAALSQFVAAFIFFFVGGMPPISPIPGSPSYAGMLTFIFLPILCALAINMPSDLTHTTKLEPIYHKGLNAISSEFGRLMVMTFILAFAASMVRAAVAHHMEPTASFVENNILMFIRMVMGIVMILVAFYMAVHNMNFGRVYSLIAIIVVLAMIFASAFTGFLGSLSLVIYAAFNLFEMVLWCLFALVVYQKRISPILVFGLGCGIYGLGISTGWAFGAYFLPMMESPAMVQSLLIIVAMIVLVVSVMLFNDRIYDNMFVPLSDDEPTLEDLSSLPIGATGTSVGEDEMGQAPFREAVKNIASDHGLSPREQEVFVYLAMGRGSDHIAGELQLSNNTVRTHTHNIYVKLDVHSREELLDLMEKYKSRASRK